MGPMPQEKTAPKRNMYALIKHSATIQMSNNVGLLSRKCWNILLWHAYPHLKSREKHRIRVKGLKKLLDIKTRNHVKLKKSLEDLVGVKVEWNLLDKDKEHEWGVTTLLSQVSIKHGICTYEYSSFMREALSEPNMYARIDLHMQDQFKSKYSLAMYELLLDYFDRKRKLAETPWIEIDRFKELLGAKGKYESFRTFKRRVLQYAIQEMDEEVGIDVEVQCLREGRSVAYVKLLCKEHYGVKMKPYQKGAVPFSSGTDFTDHDDLSDVL